MLTNKERQYKIRGTRQDTIGTQDIALTNLNQEKKTITKTTKHVKRVRGLTLKDAQTLEGSTENSYFRKALKAKKLSGPLSLAAVQI